MTWLSKLFNTVTRDIPEIFLQMQKDFIQWEPRPWWVTDTPKVRAATATAKEKMKVYVTFGQKHSHAIGGIILDKDCVVVIDCEHYGEGRQKAFKLFGEKFSTVYLRDGVDMHFYPRGMFEVSMNDFTRYLFPLSAH